MPLESNCLNAKYKCVLSIIEYLTVVLHLGNKVMFCNVFPVINFETVEYMVYNVLHVNDFQGKSF